MAAQFSRIALGMTVTLFIPGFVGRFYPQVGIATAGILKSLDTRSLARKVQPAAVNPLSTPDTGTKSAM